MASTTPTTFSRYKPAVIAFTILSAAYALYLLRQQAVEISELPQIQSPNLHRSNAIRRLGRRSTTTTLARLNRVDRAVINAIDRDQRGESYGEYTIRWEPNENELTDVRAGASVELHARLLLDHLEGLRGADWPESLMQALHLQFPVAFFRAFLREEFTTALNNEEAARLRLMFPVHLDSAEFLRQIEDFNAEARTAAAAPGTQPSFRANQRQHNPADHAQVDGGGEINSQNDFVQALEHHGTVVESDSEDSLADRESLDASRNMMDLLYHIGGEQARRAYYVHRGVQCNSCGATPIQGVRYHCVNCYDYDLCEVCEAGQVHIKTHVFLKIRLPGPTRGGVKDVTPPWYPGKPEMTRETLPNWVSRYLLKELKIDKTELDALYDQFRSLAGAAYHRDLLGIGMAIDRAGFDQYFAVSGTSRHSPPLLVYDRIFAFYDTNHDGLIDFEEFVHGLMNLQDESRDARLRRIFRGYDVDDDGYVDRKDFLRMFRSYYAYIKEINREIVAHLEEENTADGLRELLESSQPISAAFTGAIPEGSTSRAGLSKEQGPNGDFIIRDNQGAIGEDLEPYADRSKVIASAATRPSGYLSNGHLLHTSRSQQTRDESAMAGMSVVLEESATREIDDTTEEDESGDTSSNQVDEWPPMDMVETSDIVTALGRDIPLGEIMDPLDRSRVIHAQADRVNIENGLIIQERRNKALQERWRRRQFYTDEEEGMVEPHGYTEEDSSEDENSEEPLEPAANSTFLSGRPSMRSRSSSKVRFEDSLTDTDFETRSNTSSRSIPVNERWGGFELSEAEREIGKEILYQTVQQSYNELLDILFREKEDLCLSARRTRSEREDRADEIRRYNEDQKQERKNDEDALRAADMLRTEELFATAVNGDVRLSSSLQVDPETASINSHNAKIESTEDVSPTLADDNGDVDSGIRSDPTLPQNRPDDNSDLDMDQDPTLPQFRPDHLSPSVSLTAEPQQLDLKKVKALPKTTLAVLAAHDAHDVEAGERGGPGRISFEEFAAKMIEDQRDEVENALGRIGRDEDKEGNWPTSADLGKLQFIGAWLEWASF